MKGIFVKELEEIENLIDRGKYNKALERIDLINIRDEISIEEKIKCKNHKTRIYSEASKYSEAIKFGEEAFEESQKINNKFLMFDSLVHSPYIYFLAGEYELRKEKVKLAGQILDSFHEKTSKDYFRRKAIFLTMKKDSFEIDIENLSESTVISKKFGFDIQLIKSYQNIGSSYIWAGDLTKAIKFSQKALELSEKLDYPLGINNAVHCLAVSYMHRGELDLGLKYLLQSRSFFDDVNDLHALACYFLDLGYLNWLRRDLKIALENYNKAISMFKEAKVVKTRHLPWTLFRMNLVLIELNEYEEAFQNLNQIELLFLLNDKIVFKMFYHLSKAILLKSESDEDGWDVAMTLLEEVADEQIIYLELNSLIIFHLCDSYLKKIQETSNLDLFEKLKKRIEKLTQLAEQQKSYILLAQSLLLQSKLELIDLNISKGQLLLERAQTLAEEKGIINLAKMISNEYDILLNQLSTWEEMSKYLPSLEERFEFTHIEDLLSKLMRNYIIHESVDDEKESPLFFLIIDKEGTILFSEQFSNVSLEEELLQEILVSIDSCKSSETKKIETIERIKHGKYTTVINVQEDLLIVYTFIGKSYYAIQKINYLIKEFRIFTSEWNVFFEKIKENKELTFSDRKQLSEYLESIFM